MSQGWFIVGPKPRVEVALATQWIICRAQSTFQNELKIIFLEAKDEDVIDNDLEMGRRSPSEGL